MKREVFYILTLTQYIVSCVGVNTANWCDSFLKVNSQTSRYEETSSKKVVVFETAKFSPV